LKNCKGCDWGSYPDPSSDICDGCRHDPDTGWGGFTDHAVGKHFYTEKEQQEYYEKIRDREDEFEDEENRT